jgi:hypothetical protein
MSFCTCGHSADEHNHEVDGRFPCNHIEPDLTECPCEHFEIELPF